MALIKLDIGCGTQKREGFVGLDRRTFPGVDVVHDITKHPWPFADSSVEEIWCSHVLEHLDHNAHNPERVRFMNEVYRILVPGGKATIVVPPWSSNRAYGDFTHADKPVSEFFWFYLNKEWRRVNAPDNDIEWNPDGYTCDFDFGAGYDGLHPELVHKPDLHKQFATAFYKDVWANMIATITSRKAQPK